MSKETSTVNIRELAMQALIMVLEENKTSSEVLSGVLEKYQYLPKQDRAFFTRLCEGTMERAIELDYVINQFSRTKTKKMKPVIRTILRMGTYQILYMNQVPDSATCNESVKLAKKKGFHTLTGFVNGILRNIGRNKKNLVYPDKEKDFLSYLNIVYSMPMWILEKWSKIYTNEQLETMAEYFAKESKTTIRVNTQKIEKKTYVQLLEEANIYVKDGIYYENALVISGYNTIQGLPGYKEGYFTVQDESSMLAVLCGGIKPGMQILDVCAAPGGKTMFAAALLNGSGKIIACDVSEHKVERIQENVSRLGLTNVEANVWDAVEFEPEWKEQMDIVIADVPCSGLGVIGKKSDIKYNCSQEGIHNLRDIQRKILANVSQYVKPGGVLLFSTCTVVEEENKENAEWFSKNFDFQYESLEPYLPEQLKESTAKDGYLQLLPGIHQTDGFFMARFRKR
ncbi:16S rRNA (cytosine(967)-C(5))-methyltransferase RsmB [[Clostridium] polysaccharolyticum]|uniref:16S rRNA (cytosine(967)-C(5))-methyltransferase n=1 Tax=[Clostridium] polysaccharolyticum TaxID=29364 RepID=A0A1H9Y1R8_9FIRM|nr:16S rRNA (cytosine(967)-C(5))-methyltransferase RsmB [[Clostridium] polysaccharolyticum]SES62223.1 16S rRNA (cytosine967-C5)-methyltransferase [[Clostridium] polysaccharolyticum]